MQADSRLALLDALADSVHSISLLVDWPHKFVVGEAHRIADPEVKESMLLVENFESNVIFCFGQGLIHDPID